MKVIRPRKHMKNLEVVVLFCSCLLFLIGCSHGSRKKLVAVQVESPIQLQIKSVSGREYQTQFFSHTHSQSFLEGQIVKKKDEIVEFQLQERTRSVDPEGRIVVESTTIKKDGMVDLNDLAFPELEEVIEFVYSPNGKVIRAGTYPDWSIFYVPPIPLPDFKVDVGDTWEMTKSWRSLKNGIPLKVQVAAILKGILKCGKNLCADIELSGDVAVVNLPNTDMQFQSDIYGRMLFDIKKGVNLWSQIQSRENLSIQSQQTAVKGCLQSQLMKQNILGTEDQVQCQPTGEPVQPPYL